MREAYDSKKKGKRKGREQSGTSEEIKIVESFFCYRHPRPPLTDPRAIYNTSTIKMRKTL